MNKLGKWRWIFIVAAVLFWTLGPAWAKSARHFGYELWPLLAILILVLVSPLVALVDAILSYSRYRLGKLGLDIFAWRIAWAFALSLNFLAILWIMQLEGVHFIPAK